MPGMSGLQFLAALREDEALRHCPCIAVSAHAMAAEVDQALAAGFDDYLTKPIDADDLFQAVRRQLRR